MMTSTAYLFVTFVLVATPGAATAVVLRNAVAGGWRFGVSTAVGAAIGNSTHAAAAGLGLALLFQRWPVALLALRIGGGLYLAWLGVRNVRRALGRPQASLVGAADGAEASTSDSPLGQGLLASLLNPPIVVFYLVVVPTFVPPGAGLAAFALLAAIHVSMAFVCHCSWAVAFGRVRGLVRRSGRVRFLEMGAGVVLIYLAVVTLWRP
jgi:threonine/homoserine/homoserine lactone efflux protein